MKKLFLKLLKLSVLLTLVLSLFNCGSGDAPSISVQPSQDVFEQEAVERVSSMDILWVVDNSGSMRSFQEKVENEIVSFMRNFTQKDFNDFQIGIISTAAWQGLRRSEYTNWNDESAGFVVEDLPLSAENPLGYDYETDSDDRFQNITSSRLDSEFCSQCDNGNGRDVSIFDNTLLQELRVYCEDPINSCDGDDVFTSLISASIQSLGTNGTGDERAFESIQAARLNPDNSEFFRSNAHTAYIIVSDEDDVSRPSVGCSASDSTGSISCANSFAPSYFKSFVDLASNEILGATVHTLAINSIDEYPDNVIATAQEFEDPANGDSDGPFRETRTFFSPSRLECRTANIEGGPNIFARFFGVRTTELAILTDGVVASLCGDYAESLDNIAQTIIERTSEFFLGDRVPSQQTLDQGLVFVAVRNPGEADFTPIDRDTNGDNGWDYNPSNNSIVFFGDAIPVNGAEVSVVFDRQRFD